LKRNLGEKEEDSKSKGKVQGGLGEESQKKNRNRGKKRGALKGRVASVQKKKSSESKRVLGKEIKSPTREA